MSPFVVSRLIAYSAIMRFRLLLVLSCLTTQVTYAEDWPEWRGRGRLGVWNETGIVETFPADGLDVVWRTPIGSGFTGPSVANGRVFVTDFRKTQGYRGFERILALDEETGRSSGSRSGKSTTGA